LLPTTCSLEHLVAYAPKGQANIEAFNKQIVQQRGGERAVLTEAIFSARPCFGCISDQRIRRSWLDRAQSGGDCAERRRTRPLHRSRKWIVAAGVENHEPQSLCPLDRLEESVERDRFVFGVAVTRQLRIHWN